MTDPGKLEVRASRVLRGRLALLSSLGKVWKVEAASRGCCVPAMSAGLTPEQLSEGKAGGQRLGVVKAAVPC